MAIIPILARFLQQKKEAFGIRGRFLSLGKQSIILTSAQFEAIFLSPVLDPASTVTDEDLFKALGAETVESLDYFNTHATIECDLNYPLEHIKEIQNTFDCIFDGGTLEHIFNIPTCIETLCRLLKPNGTIVHVCSCQGYLNHGFYNLQPTFFYDLYHANYFAMPECYLIEFLGQDYYQYPGNCRIIRIENNDIDRSYQTANNTIVVFKAVKTDNLERLTYPIQGIYRR